MIDQVSLIKFNEVYEKTYHNVVKFVVCKCSNMDDVNDIIQEIYIDVYKKILNHGSFDNIDSYIMGIAKNKVKKHYNLLYKLRTISLFESSEDSLELLDKIPSDVNIEKIVLDKSDIELIWKYLKKKKIDIQKIFYLYYDLDLTIKEIARELDLSESYIKNCLYRTLKELQKLLRKERD